MNPTRHPEHVRSTRGFTLIELMVAITAGLFVAIAAFALARQGSRFFQQEARIANAQFSATLGFDRLRADIARAAFLSTPNVQRDPFRCGSTGGWPAGLASLGAIRIAAATPAAVQDVTNDLAPDQITLTGSYTSVEQFPVRTVEKVGGDEFRVILQQNNGAAVRAGLGAGEGGVAANLFQAGRILRILDSTGHYEFGTIASSSIDATGSVAIILKANPPIAFKKDKDATCGVEGFGVGMLANVVNTMRYEIRDLKALDLPQFRPLFGTSATAPGDERRFELVRVELDATGNEMPDSLELVAEYAVDLRFGLTVSTVPGTDPVLAEYPIGHPSVHNVAFDVATNPATPGPERIRAVRARLAVRSREADRAAAVPPPPNGPPGALFRYSMGGDGGVFARARSLTADIQLPNLAGVAW
jgi:prepilin-type N-terminal cleavage/methylation domain-containing protein